MIHVHVHVPGICTAENRFFSRDETAADRCLQDVHLVFKKSIFCPDKILVLLDWDLSSTGRQWLHPRHSLEHER